VHTRREHQTDIDRHVAALGESVILNSKAARTAFLALFSAAALVSLATGVHHAILYRCHDLQWAGAELVRQHIDPWAEELNHFPHHYPHFVTPNYLHLLYVVLLPLGAIRFDLALLVWTGVSIILSIVCVVMLGRLFQLSRAQTLFALALLWMSPPFRVVLEVGQMSFFELFFFTGAYLAASTALGGLSFGFSLAKYSFSPVAVILFLLRRRFRFLLFAAIIPTAGLLIVRLLVHTPLPKLLFEPLAVSAGPTAVSPGFADMMTLAEQSLKSSLADIRARQVAYALALVGSTAYSLYLSRYRLSRGEELTLVSLASLFFLKHLTYDYVFLVIPLCFALAQTKRAHKFALTGAVVVFWFVLTIFDRRTQNDSFVHVGLLAANCGLLAIFLVYTTRLAVSHSAERAS